MAERHRALGLTKVVVSEAGASAYLASAYASHELPDLDVSLRGAVSIARRLQDPAGKQAPPPQAAKQAPRPAGGRARPQGRSAGNSGRTDRGSSGAMADALRRAGLTPEAPQRPGTGSIG
jgi:Tex protein YqgF-like domain